MRTKQEYNNSRIPNIKMLGEIAREMLGEDLTDSEVQNVIGWSEFHAFLIEDIKSRMTMKSVKRFVDGLAMYLPNLSPSQQIALFNTYENVRSRMRVVKASELKE